VSLPEWLDKARDRGGMTPAQFYRAKISFLHEKRLPRQAGKAVICSLLEYIILPLALWLGKYGVTSIFSQLRYLLLGISRTVAFSEEWSLKVTLITYLTTCMFFLVYFAWTALTITREHAKFNYEGALTYVFRLKFKLTSSQNYGQVFNDRGIRVRNMYSVVPFEVSKTRPLPGPGSWAPWFSDVSIMVMLFGILTFYFATTRSGYPRVTSWSMIIPIFSLIELWRSGKAGLNRAVRIFVGMESALWGGFCIGNVIRDERSLILVWSTNGIIIGLMILNEYVINNWNRIDRLRYPQDRMAGMRRP
jgi:hypothetical protein